MAETDAALGFGSLIKIENPASSGTYVTIEEAQDLPEFGDDHELIEVTHQESPDRRKEFISGLAEGSEYSFSCNYIKGTAQEALRAAIGTTRNFRIVFPTTPNLTLTFPAAVLSAKISGPMKSQMMLNVRLKITGDITES